MADDETRALTHAEWLQLQGVYHLLVNACRDVNRLADAGGQLLAHGLHSDRYEGGELVDLARDRLEQGAWTGDSLESALSADEVKVDDPLDPVAPSPEQEALRTIYVMATQLEPIAEGQVSPMNRIAGIAEEARIALGEEADDGR